MKKPDVLSFLLRWLVRAAALVTTVLVLVIAGYVLINGVPQLKPSLFALKYTTSNVSMLPALLNTLMMTGLSLFIAAPLGAFSAIYLVEYAKRGNRLVKVIRLASETLAGIPSIVYGLFGLIFFVTALKWGYSLLAGAFTLAMMVLPVLMRTTEEALLAVPDSYREGSFGLGAGRLRTVFTIVLPAAVPGILAGVILAVGRVAGETAALIYTAGALEELVKSPLDSAATLSVHMYHLAGEGLHVKESYATAVVLMVMVLGINGLSSLAAGKMSKGGKCAS
ncbi:MAG: phosphate ABC transporter permease PstA [Oscillospiraceae bacterium]|jgi:phosphate transport system permease protein|nr:phosphate ABC transporter permease PstA [Oscillospiraceae bacterium]